MKRADAVYYREELSPDGSLRIGYNTMEGEKSPSIVEPNVTIVATGEMIIDFWRTRLNGSVEEFSPTGFRLKVSDHYNLITISVTVEVASRTFTLANEAGHPRPLSNLNETLSAYVDRARRDLITAAQSDKTLPAARSSRFTRWFG